MIDNVGTAHTPFFCTTLICPTWYLPSVHMSPACAVHTGAREPVSSPSAPPPAGRGLVNPAPRATPARQSGEERETHTFHIRCPPNHHHLLPTRPRAIETRGVRGQRRPTPHHPVSCTTWEASRDHTTLLSRTVSPAGRVLHTRRHARARTEAHPATATQTVGRPLRESIMLPFR